MPIRRDAKGRFASGPGGPSTGMKKMTPAKVTQSFVMTRERAWKKYKTAESPSAYKKYQKTMARATKTLVKRRKALGEMT